MVEQLKILAEQVAQGASSAKTTLPIVVRDLRGHPKEAMLLAIMVALAILLVAMIGMLVFEAAHRSAELRRAGLHARKRRSSRWWLHTMLILAVIVVLAAMSPLHPRIAAEECSACHATDDAVSFWSKSAHSQVGCYGCHASPGLLGALESSALGASRLLSASVAKPDSIDSRSCLRCHEDVLTRLVGSDVRIRHADLTDVGCVTCHEGIGHEGMFEGPAPARLMTRCLVCHDGKRAPAECKACHVTPPNDTAKSPDKADVAMAQTCNGPCHSKRVTQGCIDCHGLEMPHPDSFMSTHARTSAANPRLCAKCHESANAVMSCACHPDGQIHGSVSAWFAEHKTSARAVGPGGCACHNNGGFSQCRTCHGEAIPW